MDLDLKFANACFFFMIDRFKQSIVYFVNKFAELTFRIVVLVNIGDVQTLSD